MEENGEESLLLPNLRDEEGEEEEEGFLFLKDSQQNPHALSSLYPTVSFGGPSSTTTEEYSFNTAAALYSSLTAASLLSSSSSSNRGGLAAGSDFVLPTEIGLHIFSYLEEDIHSLANASLTCKEWQKVLMEDPRWGPLLQQHFQTRAQDGAQRRQRRQELRRGRWERGLTTACFSPCHDLVLWVFLIVGTVFVACRLDGRIEWPWFAVLLPFLLCFGQMFCGFAGYSLLRFRFASLPPFEVKDAKNVLQAMNLLTSGCCFRTKLQAIVTALLLFPAMVLLKLNGVIPHWTIAISPLLFVGLLLLWFGTFGDNDLEVRPLWQKGKEALWTCQLCFVLIPTLLFLLGLLFVTLRLDDVNHDTSFSVWKSWWYTLAPFFAVWGALYCSSTCFFCDCNLVGERWSRIPMHHPWFRLDRNLFGWCCCIFAIPVLVFLLLLTINLEEAKGWSWASIFAPLFVWEGLVGTCCCVAACNGLGKGYHYANNQSVYSLV
ncbi:hypothetical protein QOT17_025464 [Balamuthia mandrillaris]